MTEGKTALVIEDDEVIRGNILELLSEEGFTVIGAANGREGLEKALAERPDLILCDIRMPEMDGLEVLHALRQAPETRAVPFIFLTAKAERADIRAGMNLGADDYVTKPFSRLELLASIRTRLDRQATVVSAVLDGVDPPRRPSDPPPSGGATAPAPGVVVLDPIMRSVFDEARRAAESSISVLILGETGVGKEVFAHAIHGMSPRRGRQFLAINCAALSESLLESELFGYEKGAFTGASQSRPGLLESAHGGTVFLDEVGDVPPPIQVKLLRVLEERAVRRVGGRASIPIDVRVVSATNRDLESQLSDGSFRADLYFRLNGIALTLPPLRDRRSEILPLAQMFLRRSSADLSRQSVPTFSTAAEAALTGYEWPGNVRELRNAVERALVLCRGPQIDVEHLPPKVIRSTAEPSEPNGDSERPSRLRREIEEFERQRIAVALQESGGNQTLAAERLGMSRRTLVNRLNFYDLPRPRKR